jgi:hypothetical protein
LTPEGNVTEFAVAATQLAIGGDENIWFTNGQLGRITPQGQVTTHSLPGGDSAVEFRAQPDGNVWFTSTRAGTYGRLSADGTITEYRLPNTESAPWDITVGSDGNLWFTASVNAIGRLDISSLPSAVIGTATASQGVPITVPLAELSLPSSQGVQVSVDSGNGTSTPATLTQNPDGTYAVMAPIEYELSGDYPATVNVTNSAGVTTAFATTITVAPGPNQLYVTHLYRDMLGRVPDPTGILFWTAALAHGNTREQVAAGFRDSAEFRTPQVAQLYASLLGRQPDADGMSFFLNYLQRGGTFQGVENALLASPELAAIAGNTNEDLVRALYQHILGRVAEPAGLAYAKSQLDQRAGVTAVANGIAMSPEGRERLIESNYQQWLRRPADDSGLAFFMQNVAGEKMSDDLLVALLASDEYFKRA